MEGAVSPKIQEQQVDATGLWLCWREAEEFSSSSFHFQLPSVKRTGCWGGGGVGRGWHFEAVVESGRSKKPSWLGKPRKSTRLSGQWGGPVWGQGV